MFYRLPPAGEPVILPEDRSVAPGPGELFAPYASHFYGSATSALAASLVAAIARACVPAPEVLLPAYGCPALVSAVLFSGARPILVDLERDRPWMDIDGLRAALGPNTVAVVGVDLFGIPERYLDIREAIAGTGVVLVQDSAQALPPPADRRWMGDYVVLSFGRGKPVSLLHGGAVLSREDELAQLLPLPLPAKRGHSGMASRARLYNLLSSARLYWLPASLPFLGLGATHYRPLSSIEAADPLLMGWLPVNVHAHWQRGDDRQRAIHSMLADAADDRIVDLPQACGGDVPAARLLRYPILVGDPAMRRRLFRCFERRGLGVSTMYPSALPGVPGLEQLFAGVPCPQAESFARRIITLPVHCRVRQSDLRRMRGCLAHAGCMRGLRDGRSIEAKIDG
ncbi:MAG: DegT/DnrJ/EryC1/StrS family aminotransferase [Acidiferrobacterales bacterium]